MGTMGQHIAPGSAGLSWNPAIASDESEFKPVDLNGYVATSLSQIAFQICLCCVFSLLLSVSNSLFGSSRHSLNCIRDQWFCGLGVLVIGGKYKRNKTGLG